MLSGFEVFKFFVSDHLKLITKELTGEYFTVHKCYTELMHYGAVALRLNQCCSVYSGTLGFLYSC